DEERHKSPGTQVAEQIPRGGAEVIRAGDQGEAGHEVVARGEGDKPGREGNQPLVAGRKDVTIRDHGGSGQSFRLLKIFRLGSGRAFHVSRQPSARRVTGGGTGRIPLGTWARCPGACRSGRPRRENRPAAARPYRGSRPGGPARVAPRCPTPSR